MELLNEFIFLGAALIAVSIVAGMFSSRIGAPLLLVFLGLGMLVRIEAPDYAIASFQSTFVVGSIALAIILFDGGLRTPRAIFRIAMWPALSLATVGVVITTVVAGAIAILAMDLSPLQALLVGATIASTDAAAVFMLLHVRGTEIRKRVSATLEIESGANDPMAVFLTILCIKLLLAPDAHPSWEIAGMFILQMGGGAAIGIAGGYFLLWLINRIVIAAGLYPILAASVALAIFSGAQLVDASGFLAVYLAGLVLGNNRHRAQQVISRFHDGLAWLAQIVMFLLLGLLVEPRELFVGTAGALVVAIGLILVARPAAVWIALFPFKFSWQETFFIAWVGLRGAVPIFLASIPVIAGVPNGVVYFNVAFLVVLASLVIQGWTVARSARVLGLELPPPPEPIERREIDLPPSADREAASWRVAAESPALRASYSSLPLPKRTRIIAVIRDGAVMNRQGLERLEPDDYVIALAPPEHVITLDKLFAPAPPPRGRDGEPSLGAFVFAPDVRLGRLCAMYGVPFEPLDRDRTLADFMLERLGGGAAVGERVRIGEVELVVYEMAKDEIAKIGLELEPPAERTPLWRLWRRVIGRLGGG